MKLDRSAIVAQLYTVRDHCRTPAELARSVRRVREAGYAAVQASGIGEMPVEEVARILRGEGVSCAAAHQSGDKILAEPGAIADWLAVLGCREISYPYPSGRDLQSLESLKDFCRDLNGAGKTLRDRGITLSYHNHAIEFLRVGGRPVLEIIMRETDPRWLSMEIDTYWVQAGGGDPAAWCRKAAGRLSCLHLKDYGVDAAGKPVFEEIGQGNLDWPGILKEAAAAGTRWYIVEQDANWEKGDPFESLAISHRFLVGAS